MKLEWKHFRWRCFKQGTLFSTMQKTFIVHCLQWECIT